MTTEIREQIRARVLAGEGGMWDAAVLWQHVEVLEKRIEALTASVMTYPRCTDDCRKCVTGEGEHNYRESYTESLEAEIARLREALTVIADNQSAEGCLRDALGGNAAIAQAALMIDAARAKDKANAVPKTRSRYEPIPKKYA